MTKTFDNLFRSKIDLKTQVSIRVYKLNLKFLCPCIQKLTKPFHVKKFRYTSTQKLKHLAATNWLQV